MDLIFRAIESSGFSQWLREFSAALPVLLVLHTLGMGFAAGAAAAVNARVLGFAKDIPMAAVNKLLPVVWAGFAVNACSGILLLAAYPTKALSNPVFFLKLGLIAGAVSLVALMEKQLSRNIAVARVTAVLSLALWFGAITAGRLLAYTHTRLLVDLKAHF